MAEYTDREHFIPIRKSELIDLLLDAKDFPAGQRESFRDFCRILSAVFHYEYLQRQEKLKDAYAPFDPDADTKTIRPPSAEAKQRQLDDLFSQFIGLMERANFQRLSQEDIQKAMDEGASDWGLNMDVDFNVFERLEMFARGDVLSARSRRRMFNLWRLEEIKVPSYQRLVLIMKLKPHKRLGKNINTNAVFLKLFKDIPKLDIEMLLPGARMQMPKLERGKLGASLLGTIGWIGYKIFLDLKVLLGALASVNPLAFWGPLSLVAGYGYKQYYSYQVTKQTYSFQLTQSLYYQNLDNNAGVITRLLDAAEEQDAREAILAYHYLWRYAGDTGWRSTDLDDYIEMDIERLANLKVDFEIGDALEKLERLWLVEKVGDRHRAVPLDKALQQLDALWDNYFQYHNGSAAVTT
ncbi:MAG: DUF3754 domain-containing protein [Gemmataceae bacterium]